MIKAERGVKLMYIQDQRVVDLLESSREVAAFCGMDMAQAWWLPRDLSSTLTLDIQIPTRLQGWKGIIHGGVEDFIIHNMTGLASLLYSAWYDKTNVVLGKEMNVSYAHVLPLGTSVRAYASLELYDNNVIHTSGVIQSLCAENEEPKIYARGALRVKSVPSIRRP